MGHRANKKTIKKMVAESEQRTTKKVKEASEHKTIESMGRERELQSVEQKSEIETEAPVRINGTKG